MASARVGKRATSLCPTPWPLALLTFWVGVWTVGTSGAQSSSEDSGNRTVYGVRFSELELCKVFVEQRYYANGEARSRDLMLVARGLDRETCTKERLSKYPDDWIEVIGDFEDGALIALLTDVEGVSDEDFARKLGPGDYGGVTRIVKVELEPRFNERTLYDVDIKRGQRGFGLLLYFNPRQRRFDVVDVQEWVSCSGGCTSPLIDAGIAAE